MTDYSQTPEFRELAENARLHLLPKLRDSSLTVTLISGQAPDNVDVKLALELGFSIMLGKPIIVVAAPGTEVPVALRSLAVDVVEGSLEDPATVERLNHTIKEVLD